MEPAHVQLELLRTQKMLPEQFLICPLHSKMHVCICFLLNHMTFVKSVTWLSWTIPRGSVHTGLGGGVSLMSGNCFNRPCARSDLRLWLLYQLSLARGRRASRLRLVLVQILLAYLFKPRVHQGRIISHPASGCSAPVVPCLCRRKVVVSTKTPPIQGMKTICQCELGPSESCCLSCKRQNDVLLCEWKYNEVSLKQTVFNSIVMWGVFMLGIALHDSLKLCLIY